jgi:hypothetical protein
VGAADSPQAGGNRPGSIARGSQPGQAGTIDGLADIARFRTDDPDVLVAASLACPLCLRAEDIDWQAALQGYDPWVQCRCPTCEQRWRIYLTPDQALRLGLMRYAHAA